MIASNDHPAQQEMPRARNEAMLGAARNLREGRRRREQIFGGDLLADPCWDLLLDLFIAAEEGRQLSVAAACLAAPVPGSTALRCIAHLADVGLVSQCLEDGSHVGLHLALTDQAMVKLTQFLNPSESEPEQNAA